MVQGVGDGGDDADHRIGWHPVRILFAEQPADIGAVHMVHRDPQLTVVFTAVVHRDDVRMPQRGRDVGFLLEPAPVLVVRADLGRQHLQRIVAGQPRMPGQIHLAHTSGTQSPQDRVLGELLAVGERHRPRW